MSKQDALSCLDLINSKEFILSKNYTIATYKKVNYDAEHETFVFNIIPTKEVNTNKIHIPKAILLDNTCFIQKFAYNTHSLKKITQTREVKKMFFGYANHCIMINTENLTITIAKVKHKLINTIVDLASVGYA